MNYNNLIRILMTFSALLVLSACGGGVGTDITNVIPPDGTGSTTPTTSIDINGTWSYVASRPTDVSDCTYQDGSKAYPNDGQTTYREYIFTITENFGSVKVFTESGSERFAGSYSYSPYTLNLDYSDYGTLLDFFYKGSYSFQDNNYATGSYTYTKVIRDLNNYSLWISCDQIWDVTFTRIN